MASRDEILRELRLAPEWRLRRGDIVAGQVAGGPVESVPAPPPAAATRLERIATLGWDEFAADVGACTACGLCRTRNRAVPGVGDVRAQWMLIGEAPGAEEDARGEPFVGQAGKLLRPGSDQAEGRRPCVGQLGRERGYRISQPCLRYRATFLN